MMCFHCKKQIKAREPRTYVPYANGGRTVKRYWCVTCATDENIDTEYPKDSE